MAIRERRDISSNHLCTNPSQCLLVSFTFNHHIQMSLTVCCYLYILSHESSFHCIGYICCYLTKSYDFFCCVKVTKVRSLCCEAVSPSAQRKAFAVMSSSAKAGIRFYSSMIDSTQYEHTKSFQRCINVVDVRTTLYQRHDVIFLLLGRS